MGDKTEKNTRLGTVGGQAVMEGVMMKSENVVAIAVRRENGEIVKKIKGYKALKDKYKIFRIPLIRGFINFIDMMKLSMGTLTESVNMLELFEEESAAKEEAESEESSESKGETETAKEKKSGAFNMTAVASVVGIVLGLALSFVLFFFLPTFLGGTIESAFSGRGTELPAAVLSMFEGILRLAIFLGYILLVSQMKDIRRTFEYHGAEHMSIHAYESGGDLTVENVRKHTRFHPRCGTSFLIIMILIGFLVGMVLPRDEMWLRVLTRLALFPVVIGFAYEFIKLAGRHSDNIIVKIIAAPGMWVQVLTTKKPDDKQLEVAIDSLKLALKLETLEEIAVVEQTELTENE